MKLRIRCQIPKFRIVSVKSWQWSCCGGGVTIKPDLKFYLGSWHVTTSISADFGRLLSESSSAICAGNLLIIRGSARISLGCAVCRAAVCCHDNPLICNVGISRLRLSTCLSCQDLGPARWIVISEAIFWQRLHFACVLWLKGQNCATSIYCAWTLNPWGALCICPCLSLQHTLAHRCSSCLSLLNSLV